MAVRCGFFGKNKEIERIHLKFCKIVLNVKSSTSNAGVYGELGRYPLYINRFVRIIKYWGKIMQSDNVLIKLLYNELFIACNNGVKNWSYNVKQLLDKYGFSHVFKDPLLKNHSTFYLEFKSRVIVTFQQQWYVNVETSSSLNVYNYFKT